MPSENIQERPDLFISHKLFSNLEETKFEILNIFTTIHSFKLDTAQVSLPFL